MEIWKPVSGLEGFYEVSSLGRVKSNTRRVRCGENRYRQITEKILKPSVGHGSYLYVTLNARAIGVAKTEAVHRLVARAFVDKPEACDDVDLQVNHINANKSDNQAENLEWVTHAENTQHAVDMGLMVYGENHTVSKLKECDVIKIRESVLSGGDRGDLANSFGVSRATINAIMQGRVWRHLLPDGYTPPQTCVHGVANPMAKLNEAQVIAIREEYAAGGISQDALGRKYGVTQSTVKNIVKRYCWTHLEDA